MIKRLDETYRDEIMEFLNREKEINTFNIMDVRRFGIKNQFLKIYGDMNEEDKIQGLLFKCVNDITFYSYDKFDLESVCNFIRGINFNELSGKGEHIDMIAEKLGLSKCRKVNLCRLTSAEKLNNDYKSDLKIRKINLFNINKIVKLYEQINEFENTTLQMVRNNLKTGRGYCIEQDRKIVSMAKTTAENENTAMIIGVGTHPEYRNRGLATQCIQALCRELLSENIIPCLFYDNEIAGEIYLKLGFEKIDVWATYYKK